jgi:hypothetical protein
MKPLRQPLRARRAAIIAACAVPLLLALGPASAHTHWSVGIGIGFPAPLAAPYYYRGGYGGWYGYPGYYGPRWVPAPVVGAPPVVRYVAPPVFAVPPPVVVSTVPARPDPVIYPRQGQTPAQTEADRRECERWATTQPSAMGDASVFARAVEACMDGRGYSMR